MKEKWTVENKIEIWNNNSGEHFSVQLDRDCLDLIEIIQYSDDGKASFHMTLPNSVAKLLAKAIFQITYENFPHPNPLFGHYDLGKDVL